MSKPVLGLSHGDYEALYVFIGQVSLWLLEYNVDAITAAISLQKRAEAGDSALRREQGIAMAQAHVTCFPDTETLTMSNKPVTNRSEEQIADGKFKRHLRPAPPRRASSQAQQKQGHTTSPS